MQHELPAAAAERLERQIAFIVEADKLKTILRRNRVITQPDRHENDAEHSYHFALMVIVLAEHSKMPVDILRVLKMVLIHDLVEIDAGDTFIYDTAGQAGQHEREAIAAERIFGLLPADQAAEMRELWDEFEAKETAEAQFAGSLDRLQPLLGNYHTHGGAWKEFGVKAPQVYARNEVISKGSDTLWTYARGLLREAKAKGDLAAE